MAKVYRDSTPLTDAERASLQGCATAIRTKMYGKDVRDAIAAAIEMVGMPGIVSYFTPKGVKDNLAALQTVFPNGTDGIYITKDDGYWNFWDGSSWQKGNVYQAAGLSNKEIYSRHIANASFSNVLNNTIDWDLTSSWSNANWSQNGNSVTVSSDGTDQGVILTSRIDNLADDFYLNFASQPNKTNNKNVDIYLCHSGGLPFYTQLLSLSAANNISRNIHISKSTLTSLGITDEVVYFLIAVHGGDSITAQVSISNQNNFLSLDNIANEYNAYTFINDRMVNLWTGGALKFGDSTVENKSGAINVVTTKTNDGMITDYFNSDSAKTLVKLKGTFSQHSLTVQVAYTTSSGTQRYLHLDDFTNGTIDTELYFDATYLKVYGDAQKFRILVQCNDATASGNFEIVELSICSLSTFQQRKTYDANLTNMLIKITAKLDDLDGKLVSIGTQTNPILKDSSGIAYRLGVSNGSISLMKTIPSKVLFLGNSLLLGLDTDGTLGHLACVQAIISTIMLIWLNRQS